MSQMTGSRLTEMIIAETLPGFIIANVNHQLKHYKNLFKKYAEGMQDARMLGLVLFGVVVLLVTWSGIKAISTNYQLQKQITALKQQNDLQKLRNQNLKLKNDYYTTEQYLELSARRNLGLGRPGETELIVPKDVALSYTRDFGGTKNRKASEAKPFYEKNFQAWVDFFLHRRAPEV